MSFIRLGLRVATLRHPASNTGRVWNALPLRSGYAAAAGLSRDAIERRVLNVLKGFEKVDPAKVRATCFFLLVILRGN
jgi:NADH dehydrogenase (ubiquinone) 1 alpha/beta subcomplex 1